MIPQMRPALAFERPPIAPLLASISRTTRLPITQANGASDAAHHDAQDAEDEDGGRLRVVRRHRSVPGICGAP